MKYVLIILIALCSTGAKAQNYGDSIAKYSPYKDNVLTLQTLQRFSFYIGYYVENTLTPQTISNITAIQPFFGKNKKPDSLFTVPIKASWIVGGLEYLLASSGAAADKYKIIYNFPTVAGGYTSYATQVQNKALNEADPQKNAARYVYYWYLMRDPQVSQPIEEKKQQMADTWPSN